MKRLILSLALLSGTALLIGAGHARLAAQDTGASDGVVAGQFAPDQRFGAGPAPELRALLDAVRAPQQHQVRIERRVIIRISPAAPARRLQPLPEDTSATSAPTYREVPYEQDCIVIEAIEGARPAGGNRLLLYMANRDVLTARLEASCAASAFYQGFYVERGEDGRVCIARDRLLSRAGASCMIESLGQLTAVED